MLSAYERHRKALTRATRPVALLVACLLVSLLAGILLVAQQQTHQVEASERLLAAEALRTTEGRLAQNIVDYATWEDVGLRVAQARDEGWAEANLGPTLLQTFGIDLVFLLLPEGETIYAARDGARARESVEAVLTEGWPSLLQDARAAPRGTAATGLVLADGQPAVAAASSVVQPEARPDAAAPVLVFVHRLGPRLLGEMSRSYSLPDLALTTARPPASASLSLATRDGRNLGYLDWRGSSIGNDLLRVTLPIWAILTLACAATAFVIRRQADQAAHRLSVGEWRIKHDVLTELPNRVFLSERLEDLCGDLEATGRGFAVLYLDLDGFKTVNDTQGHEAGDDVLRVVAERIRAAIAPEDLAVRLGGDEFCVVLGSPARPAQVLPVAERLIAAISRPISVHKGVKVQVGATVGVTIAPEDGTSPRQLLHRADDALYYGKRIGKGRICFHRDLPLEGDRAGLERSAWSVLGQRSLEQSDL